jgi:CBS domain-containing protein
MRAGELARPYPAVAVDTPALDAARLLAGRDLPGLVVVDPAGRPVTVLPGTGVVRMAVPGYCQDDPALARVIAEPTVDLFLRELSGRTVADCLPDDRPELAAVDADATLLEIAALMARTGCPVVAVVDADGRMRGAVTLDALLERVLRS